LAGEESRARSGALKRGEIEMLRWALGFFVIALIAGPV
jgi:hypothetical protein